MELEEIKAKLAAERGEVKKLLTSILEDEGKLDNPFILYSACKDLYAHARIIMDLKMAAPADAEI